MSKRLLSILLTCAILIMGLTMISTMGASADTALAWRDINEDALTLRGERQIIPQAYRLVATDQAALAKILDSAPLERSADAEQRTVVLPLPLPNGAIGRFSIVESPMMEPALAAKFPAIKTYSGQGLDDSTATVRLDRTSAGFHALILSNGDNVYIDPYSTGQPEYLISYFERDFAASAERRQERAANEIVVPAMEDARDRSEQEQLFPSGPILRTYRLAMAATGEYTQFHGGTVAAGLSAVVTSINRINAVYEREIAVRLILIGNNDLLIYTNGATDPYTNNSGSTMLNENQTNINNVIGSANYDIGHVFSTGGGGVAQLVSVCGTSKARGVTGRGSPVGDPFDIDYVAHEIGHQFGGNHTFNGTTGSCGGGNRSAGAAYEPGSGSTIMAYAGICGAEDLQPNSDPYFHSKSYEEMTTFINGSGNSCATQVSTGNSAPTVNAGASFTIPANTPFTLTGSASDPNGDTLTYNWEQYNLGTASTSANINIDDGSRPLFRSFNASNSPSRTFPKLANILANTTTIGEILPTTSRTLTFRLTARDNRAGGGGIDFGTTSVIVNASAGPFAVTAPNTAVSWVGESSETVTWNVANTTAAPVSCPSVDVLFSFDGGVTFPTTLLAATPNDGTQAITVPNLNTTLARIKVACANSIFFDISNANFTITASGGPTATPVPPTETPVTPTETPVTPTVTGTLPTTPPTNTPITPTATQPVGNCLLNEGFDNVAGLAGAGWSLQNLSSPVGTSGWFQGNATVFPAFSGATTSYVGANFNNTGSTGTISNWLLTPVQNLANGDTFRFRTRIPAGTEYPDRLEVRLSIAGTSTNVGTSSTSVGDFTTLLLSVNPTLTTGVYPQEWTEFTATVSGLAAPTSGRIGFRYFVTNAGLNGINSNYIGIDDARYCASTGTTPTVTGTPPTTPPTNTPITPTATEPVGNCLLNEGFDNVAGLAGAGWSLQNLSNPVGTSGWFQGNATVFPAFSGATTSYVGANFNNTGSTGTISNWLLTPVQNLANGDTFRFRTRIPATTEYPDRLEVRLSTAGTSTNVGASDTSVGDFTTLLLSVNPTLTTGVYPQEWTEFTATVSGLAAPTSGRIGFRYFVTNAGANGANSNYIGIDDARYCASAGTTPTATVATPTATVATPTAVTPTVTSTTPTVVVPEDNIYLPLILR